MLTDMQACKIVREECQEKLESKKNDFNKMKREMAEIESTETKLKEEIDRLLKERNTTKDKCDRIKQNIR